jgi:hypothetical protein
MVPPKSIALLLSGLQADVQTIYTTAALNKPKLSEIVPLVYSFERLTSHRGGYLSSLSRLVAAVNWVAGNLL